MYICVHLSTYISTNIYTSIQASLDESDKEAADAMEGRGAVDEQRLKNEMAKIREREDW